jgi:hypothetical protein
VTWQQRAGLLDCLLDLLQAGAERVAKLRRTQDQCHRRVTDLKNYTKALFDGVFAHRFR